MIAKLNPTVFVTAVDPRALALRAPQSRRVVRVSMRDLSAASGPLARAIAGARKTLMDVPILRMK
jgi:hypothetical protein